LFAKGPVEEQPSMKKEFGSSPFPRKLPRKMGEILQKYDTNQLWEFLKFFQSKIFYFCAA
jgi:hypothetical protein